MPSTPTGLFGRYAAAVIAKPRRASLWIVLVSVIAAALATQIRIDPNMLALLPPDHPSTQAMFDLQTAEGGVELHTIAVDGTSGEAVDAYMRELAK